jgi:hypothetical protein
MFKKLLLIMLMTFALLFVGCDKDDDGDGDTNTNIPADPVNVTPPTPTKNNVQPTATFSAQGERVQLNVQGLVDPTTQQPITLYYNSENPASSNIFVQQNGVTKGLMVTKVGSGTTLKADVVFTVDNSGSMGEEADVVAAGIVNFANALASSGLDVQFGCVGYDSYANGAINLTTAANLSTHLNRSGYTGTSRTYGFSGSDASTLETNASNFGYAGGENGVLATLFAYQHFAWRSGASKVFINFTDEPTQPAYNDLSFNTAELCNTIGGVATVHTVFSEDTSYYSDYNYWSEYNERPWKMSECTGGTVKFVDPYATNLVLTDLPVVGALSNSYLVEYMKGSSAVQSWLVTITVYTSTADGSTTYNATY